MLSKNALNDIICDIHFITTLKNIKVDHKKGYPFISNDGIGHYAMPNRNAEGINAIKSMYSNAMHAAAHEFCTTSYQKAIDDLIIDLAMHKISISEADKIIASLNHLRSSVFYNGSGDGNGNGKYTKRNGEALITKNMADSDIEKEHVSKYSTAMWRKLYTSVKAAHLVRIKSCKILEKNLRTNLADAVLKEVHR